MSVRYAGKRPIGIPQQADAMGHFQTHATQQMSMQHKDRRFLAMRLARLIFIPITVAAYEGTSRATSDQASSLVNASIGISLANNVLAHRQQFHQNRSIELVSSTWQYHARFRCRLSRSEAHERVVAESDLILTAHRNFR